MSHVSEVKAEIQDLDALAAACGAVGMEFMRGQTTHKWFGQFVNDWHDPARSAQMQGRDPSTFGRCDHAIRLRNPRGDDYEIGICRRTDGKPGFSLVYDLWGPGQRLEAAAGKALVTLRDHYNAQTTSRQLAKEGWRTRIVKNKQGQLQVAAVMACLLAFLLAAAFPTAARGECYTFETNCTACNECNQAGSTTLACQIDCALCRLCEMTTTTMTTTTGVPASSTTTTTGPLAPPCGAGKFVSQVCRRGRDKLWCVTTWRVP